MKNEVFRNRGLPARILYSRPASRVGSRKYKVPELPAKLEAEYFKLILDLLNISPGTQAGELRLDSGLMNVRNSILRLWKQGL